MPRKGVITPPHKHTPDVVIILAWHFQNSNLIQCLFGSQVPKCSQQIQDHMSII